MLATNTPMKPKILVIGEAFLDRWLVGRPRALSAEAPIPIFDIIAIHELPGGAANVAQHLRALGCGVIERFQSGAWPIKNRLVSGTQQIARWDEDDQIAPIEGTPEGPDFDSVVISDYGKGMFSESIWGDPDVPVFIDTKRSPLEFQGAWGPRTFWFPNLAEYARYADAYNEQQLVMRTEGPEGMTWLEYGEPRSHAASTASDIVSVCGAGDAAIAGFAASFSKHGSLEQAMRDAMEAAAIAISHPFTGTL